MDPTGDMPHAPIEARTPALAMNVSLPFLDPHFLL